MTLNYLEWSEIFGYLKEIGMSKWRKMEVATMIKSMDIAFVDHFSEKAK